MADKTLQVMLQFGLEGNGPQDAKKKLADMSAQFTALDKKAQSLRKSIADFEKQFSGLQAEGLRKDLAQVERQMQAIAKTARDDVARSFEDAQRELSGMSEIAERMEGVSIRLGAVGIGIVASYRQAAQAYVQSYGAGEEASRKMLAANASLEAAQIRMGRVAADALAPYEKALADVSNKMADMAEKSPLLAQGIMAGGAVLTAAGGAGGLLAQGLRLVTDAKLLTAAAMQKTAADTMLTAAGMQLSASKGGAGVGGVAGKAAGVVGVLGAVGSGVALGGAAYNALRGGQGEDAFQTMGKTAALSASGLAGIFGFVKSLGNADVAAKDAGIAFANIASALGVMDDATRDGILAHQGLAIATQAAQKPIEDLTLSFGPLNEGVQGYIQYQKQLADFDKQLAQQHEKINADTEKRKTETQANYDKTRLQMQSDFTRDAIRDRQAFERRQAMAEREFRRNEAQTVAQFQQSQLSAEKDYYKARADRAAQYGLEEQQAEAEHQKSMRRMQEDFQISMDEAVAGRDAITAVRLMRQNELQRRRAEEDYGDQSKTRNESYAREIAQMETAFAEQNKARLDQFDTERAARQAEFERRKANDQTEFDYENKQRQLQFDERLAEFDKQHQEELGKLETQRADMLAELDKTGKEQKDKIKNDYADSLALHKQYLDAEKGVLSEYYAAMVTGYKDTLAKIAAGDLGELPQVSQTTPQPDQARALGGYADYGKYTLGESGREFVLSAPTTSRAEAALGGPLSQDNLLNALAGGQRGGGRGVSLSLTVDLRGNVNDAALERRFRETATQVGNQLLSDFVRQIE